MIGPVSNRRDTPNRAMARPSHKNDRRLRVLLVLRPNTALDRW